MRLALFVLLSIFCYSFTHAQTASVKQLKWNSPQQLYVSETDTIYNLSFENAIYPLTQLELPVYLDYFKLPSLTTNYTLSLSEVKYLPCTQQEEQILKKIGLTHDSISLQVQQKLVDGESVLELMLMPIRFNSLLLRYEKAYSFHVNYKQIAAKSTTVKGSSKSSASTSVLATGTFYKVCASQTGMYKLTYTDLVTLGINVSGIDPRSISLFGNGGGMLSEKNSDPRYDDLQENAIFVSGQSDGKFDETDYILFYATSPVTWKYNTAEGRFRHSINLYSDNTCYFLSTDKGTAKRYSASVTPSGTATHTVTTFNDYQYHHVDKYNLLKTGREWYGESFETVSSYDFAFAFPNVDASKQIHVRSEVAARSSSISSFVVKANGYSSTSNVAAVSFSQYNGEYAKAATNQLNYTPSSSTVDVNISYVKPIQNALGWLNYIEVNAQQHLKFYGNQMLFRNVDCVGSGNITEFVMGDASSALTILNVTDPINPSIVQYTLNGSSLSFKATTATLQEFIAYNSASFYSPSLLGSVSNQNLHALSVPDMLIITHETLKTEADRVAKLHRDLDGMLVHVVTIAQVYNEFSSGIQDVSAIRDFAKMFYDRDTLNAQKKFKYLMLVGDGSYDYKSRFKDNSNLIPTYESPMSLQPIGSYLTDDFFGLLDNGEGLNANGSIDIGIGRLPVKTLEEVKPIVDKLYRYTSAVNLVTKEESDYIFSNYGDWRNIITFIADDEDNNLHIIQSDQLATLVDTTYKQFNVEKIYLDSYKQISNSSGQRYPEVNAAINSRVNRGALIMNYTGHGGELGLAHERVLGLADINTWTNTNNMMVFITATCEFSRFDDPERTAAGEYVLLSDTGGAIALFTTTRLAFASSNYALNKSFYNYAFTKINGEFPKLGDLIRQTKNANANNENIKNFVLLGDPALQMVYPKHEVVTTLINQDSIAVFNDTIHALSTVSVSGYIADASGNKLTTFNGELVAKIFDKENVVTTNANDASSTPKTFKVRNSILYKGKASVVNGEFTYSFIVPKDIAYNIDYGKISHYAMSDEADASGYYNGVLIGGFSSNYDLDTEGPVIKLFMNDTTFDSGDITDENPILLAYISDKNGINTTGNGIGHDIVAFLDDDYNNTVVLNDYYSAEMDSYNKGKARYPFSKLSIGKHTVTVRAWDIYNNTSTSTIEFEVQNSISLAIDDVKFYPNPLRDRSTFYFQHNLPNRLLDVEIEIYSLDGRLVKLINEGSKSYGYNSQTISWDGTGNDGGQVEQGIYVYRMKVISPEGFSATKSGKLVVLR